MQSRFIFLVSHNNTQDNIFWSVSGIGVNYGMTRVAGKSSVGAPASWCSEGGLEAAADWRPGSQIDENVATRNLICW